MAQVAFRSKARPPAIQDDSAGGWRPDVPWTGSGFRAPVQEEDLATARQVLDRADETRAKA